VPTKLGSPYRQGGWKKFRNAINGRVKINGGSSNLGKGFKRLQGWKEQKQVVIEHKTKIYTAVRHFAIKIGRK